jgi:hypothetical protein
MAFTRDEFSAMESWLTEIVGLAKRCYVGRTNFPERRLLQHMAGEGRNKLFSLCWTMRAGDAAGLEELLIDRVKHLARVENIADDSRGAWGSPPHAIYVSWVWRAGVPQDTLIGGMSAKIVDELPPAPGRSRFLRTTLDRGGAFRAAG